MKILKYIWKELNCWPWILLKDIQSLTTRPDTLLTMPLGESPHKFPDVWFWRTTHRRTSSVSIRGLRFPRRGEKQRNERAELLLPSARSLAARSQWRFIVVSYNFQIQTSLAVQQSSRWWSKLFFHRFIIIQSHYVIFYCPDNWLQPCKRS